MPRSTVLIAWLFLLVAVFAAAPSPLACGDGRPNILFIMSDDHAYQAVGAYGSRLNATPNIDCIADQGVRFDRCYVTNSICGPSRACILTGKYSHQNGVYDNFTEYDSRQSTFPKLLQAAGYQTAIIGKWHLKSEPTGFDHWEILPDQGKYYRPEFITTSGTVSEPGYATELITEKSVDWLRNGRDAGRPFLLMVHHKAPHRPWQPAAEKLAQYEDESLPEPATLFDDYASRGTAARRAEMRIDQMNPIVDLKLWDRKNKERAWLYGQMTPDDRAEWEARVDPRLAAFERAKPQGPDRTRWFYQLYIKDYLRCVAGVDDGVGRLLDCLDELKLADNTIVIYTSDQGFYLGEHGWFDKRFMYEQSLRTPLVVRWPGVVQPGRVEERIVSNVDFAPTFLQAAGAPVPSELQGRSFVPLLCGETPDDWRAAFYYHYYEGVEREHHVYPHEGVTTGTAKLIHYYPLDEWELFDLESDPQEMANLYGQPERASLQARLKHDLALLRQKLQVPVAE